MKVFIFIYNSLSDSGVARREKGESSPLRNPGKFAKDEEQPKPQKKFTLRKHLKNLYKICTKI